MKKQSLFEKKVRRMKVSEIVQSMIAGLKKRHVKIQMNSFGYVQDGVCYGCAATNSICEIMDHRMTPDEMGLLYGKGVHSEYPFLWGFELAINGLRKGNIQLYNSNAEEVGIKKIPEIFIDEYLPYLNSNYTSSDLSIYQKFADKLKSAGY